jgi:hypothetical protein
MKITKDRVVRLSVEMAEAGATGAAHELQYLHGGNLFPKVDATLDGNHPFAGRTVELRCEVLEVRVATQEEISH